jgi:hypothetical protein
MPTTKFCIFLFSGIIAGNSWHVSNNGTDSNTCGDSHNPCLSISQVMQQSTDGDTIELHIFPSDPGDNIVIECTNVVINKSLTFIGHGELVNIGYLNRINSSSAYDNIIFRILPPTDEYINVIFKNLQFTNGYIYISHGYIGLFSCSLVNAAFRSVIGCQGLNIDVHNTSISIAEESPSANTALYDTSFFCQHITANITNTTVSDVNINFDGKFSCHVSVHRCTFTKIHAFETGMGGVNISVAQENGSVTVTNSTFNKFTHFNPIQSSINIF